MQFELLDCLQMALVLGVMLTVAYFTRSYTKSVSDFLAASRCAKRYLLSVSEGMAALGSLTIIAYFEMYYRGGFVLVWWGFLVIPVLFVMTLLGWVYYRFRCTRALTFAQLFELRYNRQFRVFVGIICFFSGILTFGIAPGVTSRFFVQFFKLPELISIAGIHIPSFLMVMFFILAIALLYVFWGGQIVVLVTDTLQGIYCNILFVVIIGVLLYKVDWLHIEDVLMSTPSGQSLVNPFDATKVKSFNLWYFLIGTISVIYNFSGSAVGQGANISAKSAHEAKMGKIISNWRNIGMYLMLAFIPVCANVIMNHSGMGHISDKVNASLAKYADPEVRSQMMTPEVLIAVLPRFLTGAFGAMMLLAFISSTDTLIHAYGSIFIQDIILPFRKKHFSPETHLKLLRIAIVSVTVFIFILSALYTPKQHLLLLLSGISAISCGTGAALIGGLYWRKGTTKGAFAGVITAAVIAIIGLVLNDYNVNMFFDGQWFYLFSMIGATVAYVVVSLLDSQKDFDLDGLLHKDERSPDGLGCKSAKNGEDRVLSKFMKRFGITSEFTFGDQIMYFSVAGWGVLLGLLFFGPLIAGLIFHMSNNWWMQLWKIYVIVMFVIACGTTIWFTFGAFRDIKYLFIDLKGTVGDRNDDGMVDHGGNIESAIEREAVTKGGS